MRAEFIRYDEEHAICWIEFRDGEAVRVALRLEHIPFKLIEGDEFDWDTDKKIATKRMPTPEEEAERQKIKEELKRLDEEWEFLKRSELNEKA